MNISRRKFIGAGAVVAGGAYINHRGLRYPRMGFEHRPPARQLDSENQSIALREMIAVRSATNTSGVTQSEPLRLRAYALEPAMSIQRHQAGRLTISIDNISAKARLKVGGTNLPEIHESVNGLRRTLEITFRQAQELEVEWRLDPQDGSRFAVIGDTGGTDELGWVLQRAKELQADFLLHLGDFNYNEGEYDRAIEFFNNADMPIFISIGNHDYNDSGLIYKQFLDELAPMDHSFSFAGTRFINFDTAADFFPAWSGQRGVLFDELSADSNTYQDNVFFTHRLFVDPRPGQHHIIGGIGEIDWLVGQIKQAGGHHMLTGHVHHSAEMDYEGIRQITAGEGLGHEDIVHERQIAQMLMGELQATGPVKYRWEAINMPWSMHNNPFHEREIIKRFDAKKMQWYRNKLATADS